jgi:drug/metabolite transporter (DMT)-like permease
MGDWIVATAGSAEGARLAMGLALFAAIMHAVFGALQKGRHDPWLTRGAIDFCYGIIALPFALFVVPWPEPFMWPIFAVMVVIHVIYKLTQGMAYVFGAYTVVYPVVRGLGPLVTVIAAGFVFGETFSWMQWGGVLLLTLSILALAALNLRREVVGRKALKKALVWAVAGGIMVAVYTTYDAYGIRSTADPFTFLAWFFLLDGMALSWLAALRWRALGAQAPDVWPLMQRGLVGAIIAFLSFGSIMLATRLDSVGEAAVLRETSPVFAALIGWFFLKDTVGSARFCLIALIALGAVLVEFGG